MADLESPSVCHTSARQPCVVTVVVPTKSPSTTPIALYKTPRHLIRTRARSGWDLGPWWSSLPGDHETHRRVSQGQEWKMFALWMRGWLRELPDDRSKGRTRHMDHMKTLGDFSWSASHDRACAR